MSADYYRHLSYNFANWFYSLINDDDLDKLGPEHFFVDTHIKLALHSSETNAVVVEANNAKDAAQILRDFKMQFAIKFLPNLSPDSIQYECNLNGVLKLMVCGTLHLNGESRVIGFFDQLFLLFRDIADNQNWKVQKSHITLRSAQFAIEPGPGSGNPSGVIPDNHVVRQLYSTPHSAQ